MVWSFYFLSFGFNLVFEDGVFLCSSPCCPKTSPLDQGGLELTEIHLSLPPECWD